MDIYVARQPILDKHMHLFGYELLYRRSSNNFYEGEDPNAATADLLHNTFLVMGFQKLTDGAKGFINFTRDLLTEGVPRLLPKDTVVVEILENVAADESVIAECRKLKADGYTLALDDFVFDRDHDSCRAGRNQGRIHGSRQNGLRTVSGIFFLQADDG